MQLSSISNNSFKGKLVIPYLAPAKPHSAFIRNHEEKIDVNDIKRITPERIELNDSAGGKKFKIYDDNDYIKDDYQTRFDKYHAVLSAYTAAKAAGDSDTEIEIPRVNLII